MREETGQGAVTWHGHWDNCLRRTNDLETVCKTIASLVPPAIVSWYLDKFPTLVRMERNWQKDYVVSATNNPSIRNHHSSAAGKVAENKAQ